jgi:hypothetical protein
MLRPLSQTPTLRASRHREGATTMQNRAVETRPKRMFAESPAMIDSSGCYLSAAIRLSGAEVGKRPVLTGRCRPFVGDVKPARVYWGDNTLDGYWEGFFRGLVAWVHTVCQLRRDDALHSGSCCCLHWCWEPLKLHGCPCM